MPDLASPVPFLDAATVTRLLTPVAARTAVQRFYGTHRREAVAAPERIHLPIPGHDGHVVGLYMPAATSDYIGVKLAHLMPDRTPNVEAEVFLYEAGTGRLLFWGDGKPLTALRTAAVSAAAALRLKPEVRSLLIFGSGLQAAAHLRAFAAAYPMLERTLVVARSVGAFDRLEAGLGAAISGRFALCENVPRALAEADAIVTTTPAPEPLFAWEGIPATAHLTAIGSATPAMHELPPEAFLRSEVWLDSRRALNESGDCRAALAAGWREGDVAGDLFDLLAGGAAAAPRSRPTLFKSTGQASQDLALLIALWECWRAEAPPPGR